jgi:hypothetical protein
MKLSLIGHVNKLIKKYFCGITGTKKNSPPPQKKKRKTKQNKKQIQLCYVWNGKKASWDLVYKDLRFEKEGKSAKFYL